MGNIVSEFLKPFGVDVDIKVDHKNEKEKKDETKPPSESTTGGAEKTTPKAADEPPTSSKHLANLNTESCAICWCSFVVAELISSYQEYSA